MRPDLAPLRGHDMHDRRAVMSTAPEAWNLSRRISTLNAKVGYGLSDLRDDVGDYVDATWDRIRQSDATHTADVWVLERHAQAMERWAAILETVLVDAGIVTRERLHELAEHYPARRRAHEDFRDRTWSADDLWERLVRVDDIDVHYRWERGS